MKPAADIIKSALQAEGFHTSQEILEGPGEDIVRQADEFSGKRVRLVIIEDEVPVGSNEAMLAGLREVAEIQDGMRLTAGEDSQGFCVKREKEGCMASTPASSPGSVVIDANVLIAMEGLSLANSGIEG